MTTPQEQFWAGEFGTDYIERNRNASFVAANTSLLAEALRRASPLATAAELGANVGMNVIALQVLYPDLDLTAVEINPVAAAELRKLGCTVDEMSILDWQPPAQSFDLVFTKGVLIHINPDALAGVYDSMAAASRRYVLMAEYYNPAPVTIDYRGHGDRLFKRDFAGEFLDAHDEFELVDYGFRYHRGPFPNDDLTWFLMQRRGA